MSKFSEKFFLKSPLKHYASRDDAEHSTGDPDTGHGHPPEYYEKWDKENTQSTASDEEAKKLVSGGEGGSRSDEKTAVLLAHVNAARKEQGLPPVDNLEEGLKTTPSGG